MAVNVFTTEPGALLSVIYEAIAKKHVETWEYTTVDGAVYFTHTPPQWKGLAWLKPAVFNGKLVLNIVPPKGSKISTPVYGVYHGRFIEMLLTHFDQKFSEASATAMPAPGDMVAPA